MSRRKQGRPQQRKLQFSMEQENDLLVCGDCRTRFPLKDIVQFIKHKHVCCNKENLKDPGGTSRRPDDDVTNNNSGVRDDKNTVEEEDFDDEGVDTSSRREDGDDGTLHNDTEEEDDSMDDADSLVNGEKTVVGKQTGKGIKKREIGASSSSRDLRAPLRQRQVVDAESNTTHSEPSRFVCETCRSTYTSAWALLQHAQKEHGMKIYTSPTSSGTPIDLLMSSSSPQPGLDHRSISTGSGGSPFPVSNPFSSPFRLPSDSRLSQSASLSPFSRPPGFDYDLVNDYRMRPQLVDRAGSGLDHHSFTHGPFDRSRHISPVLDSQFDFYSMRLKQLANSPAVPQSKSPFTTTSLHQPASAAPAASTSSKAESPPAEALLTLSKKGSQPTSALSLPPKQRACEFCGKTFRFQSNLVVHRRSHTGEKPYKCPHCPHACTQQSKLKRHMKTHSNKTEGATASSPLSNHKDEAECNGDEDDDDDADDDDDSEQDEDDEEEEECEEEDETEENEIDVEKQGLLEKRKEMKSKEKPAGEVRHDAKKIKIEDVHDEEGGVPNDLSAKPKPTESLLSEVMKRTGLNDIQTYSEAYKAALAESRHKYKGKSEDSTRDDSQGASVSDTKISRSGVKREVDDKDSDKEYEKEHVFLGGKDVLGKSATDESPAWPTEGIPANMDPAAAAVYSRLHPWFHADNPVRLFFAGYPSHFPNARDLSLNSENRNGVSPSVASTSSALKGDSQSMPALLKPRLTSPPSYTSHFLVATSASSSPTGNQALPGNNGTTPARKEKGRNDTCEYCGKVFKNCSNLTVHRRSHTGEKPYKCNLCSYACAQSSKLTRHMKTHGRLGKDVYTCKFCSMPFSVPSTLEKHMRKCVENRNARILAADQGDLSSESNGETSHHSDSATGAC